MQPQQARKVGIERRAAGDDGLPEKMRQGCTAKRGGGNLRTLADQAEKELVLNDHEILGRGGADKGAQRFDEFAGGQDLVVAVEEPVDLQHQLGRADVVLERLNRADEAVSVHPTVTRRSSPCRQPGARGLGGT
jgi:hypothetical protein